MLAAARRQFLSEYGAVRASEGRGSDEAAWYRELPFCTSVGALASQWKIRARSWDYLYRHILPGFVRNIGTPLRILDLGAGNCWMSWRLAELGHGPVAVDIFQDARDGLLASRHYTTLTPFSVVEAEFDNLPLADRSFDLAIFNASFHYSADYVRTLAETFRVLQPSGAAIIMDTPVYGTPEQGSRMVEERKQRYRERFGFPSDAQQSAEFLDRTTLAGLARQLKIRWAIHRPWYGWKWHSRPISAWLRGKRQPSRFWILVGERDRA